MTINTNSIQVNIIKHMGRRVSHTQIIEKVRNDIFHILEESDPANQMTKP